MSARGPVARVVEDGFDSTEPDAVYIGTVRISSHGCPTIAQKHAAAINAAHADRVAAELEAAAEMIEPSERKAGPGGPPGFVQGKEEGRILAAQHLRARAKAIREGGGK